MSINPSQKEIRSTLRILEKMYQGSGALELPSAYMTTVGVLLSARTKDEQVLKLLPNFFNAFPNVYVLAEAEIKDIETYINTIGMFRQKAKHLKKMARRIVDVYDGKVPDSMEDLVTLAGVGRKTASVVLPYMFNKPAIAVDVHVHRVVNRLGWVDTNMPAKTEKELLNLIPQSLYQTVNRVFVKFGRYICTSRKPKCWACPIQDICPVKNKNLEIPKNAEEILQKIKHQEENLQAMRSQVI